jgi:hypothetical protein
MGLVSSIGETRTAGQVRKLEREDGLGIVHQAVSRRDAEGQRPEHTQRRP